jgi:hypothetical protein
MSDRNGETARGRDSTAYRYRNRTLRNLSARKPLDNSNRTEKYGGDTLQDFLVPQDVELTVKELPAGKARSTIPDATRLEIAKMKARDLNANKIRRKLGSPLRLSEVA